MILTKKNKIEEYYIYSLSDFDKKENLLKTVQSDKSQDNTDLQACILQYFGTKYDSLFLGVVSNSLYSFITEAYARIIYCSEEDFPENAPTAAYEKLIYLSIPYIAEFAEKYEPYVVSLNANKNKLIDNVKSYVRSKAANADTPISKKFDEKFTIDDYISYLTLNYNESESEYAPIIDKLTSIKDNLESLSKELKELLECELIVYNTGIESESI